ncbi:helix-turn-helix transcriptional regulator [Blautia wexlerae]|uniref:helix-turn-helix transcriptional regulator n=1 Tax=Blautia wexlerae TaxID=418240 RepID=UPI003219C443
MTLRDIRIAKGMRQIDLAEKLGISVRTYQRIEYGEQLPNVQVAIRLQKIFCRDIEEILKQL